MNYDYSENTYGVSALSVNSFMTRVYGWLFFGLLTSAVTGVAFLSSLTTNLRMMQMVFSNGFMIGIPLIELALVFILSATINKISPILAKILFFVYAILNGVTLSLICMSYASSGVPVGMALGMAGLFFGVLTVFGFVTKADFSSIGRILMVGLVVIIIASLVNIFIGSNGLDFLICVGGLAIFVGLTVYDTQRIKKQFYAVAAQSGEDVASKLAIIGALNLYLDFVNMFLYILRLLGRRK